MLASHSASLESVVSSVKPDGVLIDISLATPSTAVPSPASEAQVQRSVSSEVAAFGLDGPVPSPMCSPFGLTNQLVDLNDLWQDKRNLNDLWQGEDEVPAGQRSPRDGLSGDGAGAVLGVDADEAGRSSESPQTQVVTAAGPEVAAVATTRTGPNTAAERRACTNYALAENIDAATVTVEMVTASEAGILHYAFLGGEVKTGSRTADGQAFYTALKKDEFRKNVYDNLMEPLQTEFRQSWCLTRDWTHVELSREKEQSWSELARKRGRKLTEVAIARELGDASNPQCIKWAAEYVAEVTALEEPLKDTAAAGTWVSKPDRGSWLEYTFIDKEHIDEFKVRKQ